MKVDFISIDNHTIPMTDFRLKWRFSDQLYGKIPDEHLNQLRPLDQEAAKYIWDYISETGLQRDVPFKKDLFGTIDNAKILDGNEKELGE